MGGRGEPMQVRPGEWGGAQPQTGGAPPPGARRAPLEKNCRFRWAAGGCWGLQMAHGVEKTPLEAMGGNLGGAPNKEAGNPTENTPLNASSPITTRCPPSLLRGCYTFVIKQKRHPQGKGREQTPCPNMRIRFGIGRACVYGHIRWKYRHERQNGRRQRSPFWFHSPASVISPLATAAQQPKVDIWT
jgi:hypothetical protein